MRRPVAGIRNRIIRIMHAVVSVPRVMVILAAPLVAQLSVLLEPELMLAGLRANFGRAGISYLFPNVTGQRDWAAVQAIAGGSEAACAGNRAAVDGIHHAK